MDASISAAEPDSRRVDEFLRGADLLPDALLLVDAGGIVVAINRAGCRLFGRAAGELVGTALQAISTDTDEHVGQLLASAARVRELMPGVLTISGPDATPVPCRSGAGLYRQATEADPALLLLRLQPREDSVSRFVALSQRVDVLTREIDSRRRAQAALFEERERLRVTLESIGDAVITTDLEGRVRFLNPVAEELTGWNADDARGLPLDEVFVIVNHDTREPVESPVSKVLREGRIVGLANHTVLIRRDGVEFPIDDSGAPVRDADGRMIGVIMVFHDISERDSLERAMRRQAAELIDADRRKDEFLAMLAHELRNPLSPLCTGLQILSMRADLSPADGALVGMMQRQVHHLTRMVNDLLDVSRITRGTIVLQKELLPLASVLKMAAELVGPQLEHRRQHLQLSLPAPEVMVEGDPTRLAQVFANLLSNASKFSADGDRIEVGCAGPVAGRIRVSVSDPGIGIAPEHLESVFDLFQQADQSLDRTQGGLGVGLTVVRALVGMHGGDVRATSAGPGHGSAFTVELPQARLRGPLAVDAQTAGQPARPLRVLVVDDNQDAAVTLQMLLEQWGHRVEIVHEGGVALDAAARLDPDVVLLDLGLPGMNGFEVARRLRERRTSTPPMIVAVTGYGRDEDRVRTHQSGFDRHLTKPVDIDALQRLLAG